MTRPIPHPERSCTGKIAFASKRDAHKALGYMGRSKAKIARSMSAYHCVHCGQFHLGHEHTAFRRAGDAS